MCLMYYIRIATELHNRVEQRPTELERITSQLRQVTLERDQAQGRLQQVLATLSLQQKHVNEITRQPWGVQNTVPP